MPSFSRRPRPELAPWVETIWATGASSMVTPYLERVLPTGNLHVVFRLSDAPLTLFDNTGASVLETVGHCVVGGARSNPYVKQVQGNAGSVGVQLRPGAAMWLLGARANELAEQHTRLDGLWGNDAARTRTQLQEIGDRPLDGSCGRDGSSLDLILRAQIDCLESLVLSRVKRLRRGPPPPQWLPYVVSALEEQVPLAQLVSESDVSHRSFINRFRNSVGLSPKTFSRVRRFQRVISALSSTTDRAAAPLSSRTPRISLAQLAVDAGYADQAHLCRDFVEFAGVSPSAYLQLAPAQPNHVQLR